MARGENCLIIVAGHPTAVTNSVITGIIEEAGNGDHIADVLGASGGVTHLTDERLLDLGAQKRKVLEGLRRTPGSVLAGTHKILTDTDATALVELLRARNIGIVFLVGGPAAIGLVRFVQEAVDKNGLDVLAFGIPVSAENDVDAGDHCAGYGSAARFAAGAARDAARAAAGGEEPIIVLELPGKESGFLAAASTLARDAHNPAPHCVLVPESPVALENVADEMRRAYQKYGYAVAVTTEGVRDENGAALDGDALAALLREKIGVAARCDKPGSLARVAQNAISRVDADEAHLLGELAVRLSGDVGEEDQKQYSGIVVVLQRDLHTADKGEKGYRAVEGTQQIAQVNEGARRLPAAFLTASGTQISDEFTEWARPLIGGALTEYTSLA
ncbi:MAG TPA: 6-phosphofructokinase [Abditibacteriaceae bacterium]